jgi:hypothetical protein
LQFRKSNNEIENLRPGYLFNADAETPAHAGIRDLSKERYRRGKKLFHQAGCLAVLE